jgi:hypothetical protein
MTSLDLFENGCIALMLCTWLDLSHGLVETTSLATRVKVMAGVLTEVLMGVLAVIWLMPSTRRCPLYPRKRTSAHGLYEYALREQDG